MTNEQLINLIAAKIAECVAEITHLRGEYATERNMIMLNWLEEKFPREYSEAVWQIAPIKPRKSRSRKCDKSVERYKKRECEKIMRI